MKIHELQKQVDTLTNENTLLENQIDQLQNNMINLDDLEMELEENHEENPGEDEAVGDKRSLMTIIDPMNIY